MNADKLKHLEEAADHVGSAFSSIFKAAVKFVAVAAPVAEAVGAATGQPEVVAAAAIASKVAGVASAAEVAKEAEASK